MKFHIKKNDIEIIKKCLICKSKKVKTLCKVYIKNKLNIFNTSVCSNCLYIFRSVRPSQKWLDKNWIKRNMFQKKGGIVFLNQKIENERKKRYNELFNILYDKIKFNNILDIGCGPGTGLIDIKKNKRVYGIESDPSRAEIAKKNGIHVFQSRLEKNNIKKKFDLVTCIQSLEHFYDPLKSLSKIKKLTKINGYIFIEVPNFFNHVHSWHDAIYLGHNSNFIELSLLNLFKYSNLKIEYIFYTQNGVYNEFNLAILAKNSKKNSPKTNYNKSKLLSQIKSKYWSGLRKNKKNNKETLKFNIEYINDLSLMYKPNHQVKYNLKENIFDRNCDYNFKNKIFDISDRKFNIKIKKNNKRKKILEKKII